MHSACCGKALLRQAKLPHAARYVDNHGPTASEDTGKQGPDQRLRWSASRRPDGRAELSASWGWLGNESLLRRERLGHPALERLARRCEALVRAVGDDLVAVRQDDAHAEVGLRAGRHGRPGLHGGLVVGALRLEKLLGRLLELCNPRVGAQRPPSQLLHHVQEHLAVARLRGGRGGCGKRR
eukprot:357281-Chlamydomonas_euryale.AAC.33